MRLGRPKVKPVHPAVLAQSRARKARADERRAREEEWVRQENLRAKEAAKHLAREAAALEAALSSGDASKPAALVGMGLPPFCATSTGAKPGMTAQSTMGVPVRVRPPRASSMPRLPKLNAEPKAVVSDILLQKVERQSLAALAGSRR